MGDQGPLSRAVSRSLSLDTQHPTAMFVSAAAVLAKGLVSVIDGGGLRAQRASALDLPDNAGRAIGDELRRGR